MIDLATHFLARKTFREHHAFYESDFRVPMDGFETVPAAIYFRGNPKNICFGLNTEGAVTNSYYVGLDWVQPGTAVYVHSKMNGGRGEVDLLKMLFQAIKHPDIMDHLDELYEIKWEEPLIPIHQQQDMLTPLLILQFLELLKTIVRKGLKKSYYTVRQEFNGRVKGKLDTAATIKQNLTKGRTLRNNCVLEEFGYNSTENRILKKALVFVQRYLAAQPSLQGSLSLGPMFNYILPAFQSVNEEVSIADCRGIRVNPFYKEYKTGVRLAIEILKRFGYNISNTSSATPSVPPFWIDMSKLFELFVLGLLRDQYGREILYGSAQAKANYGLPDYLLTKPGSQMVIDAKYKLLYNALPQGEEDEVKSQYAIDNIRQLSAYARDVKVYNKLKVAADKIVKCLIIYPDEFFGEPPALDLAQMKPIHQFVDFYKLSVKVPPIKPVKN